MSSDEKLLLQRMLAPSFHAQSFRKDGATWRQTAANTTVACNLQGSQWSRFFYVNLGAFLHELGDRPKPLHYQCHIRLRLEQLVPDRRRYHELLDFERAIAADERQHEVVALVEAHALPWLETMLDRERAFAWLRANRTLPWITPAAAALLGLPADS